MSSKTIHVPNISCGHCTQTIEREVSGLKGVESVSAEAVSKEVTIRWDEGLTNWEEIQSFMSEIHYPPSQ